MGAADRRRIKRRNDPMVPKLKSFIRDLYEITENKNGRGILKPRPLLSHLGLVKVLGF